jgi:ABC-type antimicrobial peptide transport system permease subunit
LAIHTAEENPEIEVYCRVNQGVASGVIEYEGTKFRDFKSMAVDSSFFRMFSFPLVDGNSRNPFDDDESVVISESKAKAIFGDKNPLGQIIRLGENGNFHVTAVMKDFPKNTDFEADILIPFAFLQRNYGGNMHWTRIDDDWGNFNFMTYIKLVKGVDHNALSDKMAKMFLRLIDIQLPPGFEANFPLQALTDIHLYAPDGKPAGMEKVRLFSLITVCILVIACINYVNLVTARAGKRNREMITRRILGAKRMGLTWHLMRETAFLLFIALVISVVLVWVLLPVYNRFSASEMEFHIFRPENLLLYLGTLLCVLILAGLYPAIFMSSKLQADKSKSGKQGGIHAFLRKALVVMQFTCSAGLIVCTLTIKSQLDFLREKDLGYDKEYVFTMPAISGFASYEALKAELMKNPAITAVAMSNATNMAPNSINAGIWWPGQEKSAMIYVDFITYDFMETMNIRLLSGEILSPTDNNDYILINEEAAKIMQLEDPVGVDIKTGGASSDASNTIIGVIKNYNFEPLSQPIKPLVIRISNNQQGNLYIRTTGAGARNAVSHAEELWKQSGAETNFSYSFLDDNFSKIYEKDIASGKLFTAFAIIAILISCLGLFGLVTFTAETKTKEIGIRKVLGASVTSVVKMLSKEFLILVGIAMLIAFPLAYYMLDTMLQDYAYRISIGWWIFALAGIITVVLTLLTVGWQALKAATAKPVEAIKTE